MKNDPEFKKVREVVKRRCREVTAEGGRPGRHASRAVNPDYIRRAFTEGCLGRSNPDSLVTTAQYVVQTGMGVRAIRECWSILNEDLIFGPPSKKIPEMPQYIELSERLTKTRQGEKDNRRLLEGRISLDEECPDICPVRTLLEYQRRKPESAKESKKPFFIGVSALARKNPELYPIWYVNCRMGRNTLAGNFKRAMGKAGVDVLKEKITATSARKNMMQSGVDGLVPGEVLSMIAGQKNISSKLSYIEEKEKTRMAAQLVINRRACGKSD